MRAGRRVPTDGHPNDNHLSGDDNYEEVDDNYEEVDDNYQEVDDNYQEVDDNYQEADDNYNDNDIVTDETGGRTMMELVSAGHSARA